MYHTNKYLNKPDYFYYCYRNLFMTHPKDKKKALTPLKILKMPSTPPKIFEKVWSPPKNAEYGLYPALKQGSKNAFVHRRTVIPTFLGVS